MNLIFYSFVLWKYNKRSFYCYNFVEYDLFFHFKGDSDFLVYKFLPSIESETVSNPFLPVHPEMLAKTACPVPIITGINSMEGLVGIEGKVFFF